MASRGYLNRTREIKWTAEYTRRMARERARRPEVKARRRALLGLPEPQPPRSIDEQRRLDSIREFGVFCNDQKLRLKRKLSNMDKRQDDGPLDFKRDGDVVVERRQ